MKAVLEQIEFSWWSFHIRLLDESPWIRRLLPRIRLFLQHRKEIWIALVWAALGFPLGLLLGWIHSLVR